MKQASPWTSNEHARPRPFTFYPPKDNRFVSWLGKKLLVRDIRRKLKVTQVEVQGDGLERLRKLRGERCLVTPSHCGGFEPHILMYLSKLLGDDFYFLAAQELFERSKIQRWVLQRLGVYSIVRGTVDRPSFAMTRELLAQGKRWLVVFPEGETIWQGSTVMPFQQGVFQLAFKSYEDALKSDSEASLYCIPIAIKYLYTSDMHEEIDASLTRLEWQLGIKKEPSNASHYDRMRRAAEAVLSAIEKAQHVKSDGEQSLGERIANLKLTVISRLEGQLEVKPKPGEPLLDRIRSLFNAVDRIVFSEPAVSDYEKRLVAEGQRAAESLYYDLWRLLKFVAIYDGYVHESMTVERFMDVLGLMEAEVSGGRPVWGPRKALVEVGEAVDLKDHMPAYTEDRRRAVAEVTSGVESQVTKMVERLSANGKVVT